MAKKVSETYSIDRVSFEDDHAEIVRLWSCFDEDESADTEKLRWLYAASPQGQGSAYGLRYTPSGELAGVVCFSRRALNYNGFEIAGALVADMIIDPQHRSLGPYRYLSAQAFKSALTEFCLIYGFPVVRSPTPNLGDNIEGDIDYLNNILPIDFAPYFGRWLPQRFAHLLANFVRPIFKSWSRIMARSARKAFLCRDVDGRFLDGLWDRIRNKKLLQGERNAEFVLWRLRQPPFENHEIFGIVDRNDAPCGFVAYISSETDQLQVIDICWQSTEALRCLLRTLVEKAYDLNALSIAIQAPSTAKAFVSEIRRCGFAARRQRRLRVTMTPGTQELTDNSPLWIQPIDNDYL